MRADALPVRAAPSFGATVRLLAGFELQLQGRDFFAWLAAGVFVLLTFGYSSSGVIALVSDLGAVPRHAPWALAQAMAGMTAFGQVITAMIAATAVLRDVGLRTQPLVLTSGISWRAYLAGRFAGTLAVLLVVYAAVPAGLLAGQVVALAGGAADALPISLTSYAWPLLVLVLPTVVFVAAAFFAAGALSGGFGVILLLGVGLVGLWQSGIALVTRGVVWGALVDPFGNAAMLYTTAAWTATMRAEQTMPLGPWIVANRVVWLLVAALVVAVTLVRWRPRVAVGAARVALREASTTRAADAPLLVTRRARGASAAEQFLAEWRFGLRWVRYEKGVAALVGLAVLNAAANAWGAVADGSEAVRQAVEFHSRVFGILVATIYAGELVWRDRDVGAEPLYRALPVQSAVRLAGRTAGVAAALAVLPLALAATSMLVPLARGATVHPWCDVRWFLGVSLPLFWGLLAVSLLVHVVVRHKTVAHLLLIAAWVLAIALGARALATPWAGYGRC